MTTTTTVQYRWDRAEGTVEALEAALRGLPLGHPVTLERIVWEADEAVPYTALGFVVNNYENAVTVLLHDSLDPAADREIALVFEGFANDSVQWVEWEAPGPEAFTIAGPLVAELKVIAVSASLLLVCALRLPVILTVAGYRAARHGIAAWRERRADQ